MACLYPNPPLFDAPARGNPLEFPDKSYTAKLRDGDTVRPYDKKIHRSNSNFNRF